MSLFLLPVFRWADESETTLNIQAGTGLSDCTLECTREFRMLHRIIFPNAFAGFFGATEHNGTIGSNRSKAATTHILTFAVLPLGRLYVPATPAMALVAINAETAEAVMRVPSTFKTVMITNTFSHFLLPVPPNATQMRVEGFTEPFLDRGKIELIYHTLHGMVTSVPKIGKWSAGRV